MDRVIDFVKMLLIGRPMPSASMERQLLPKRIALPVFASDALSSVAYAPDEVLLTLALAGGAAAIHSIWVGVAVVAVLAIVVLSYRQVVRAYPSGGGSYEVVSANLGRTWGLVVSSALLVDYTLTVAVSISSGAHYLTTAVPSLAGREPVIALILIAALTLMNLRGLREAGAGFAIPTYLFMASIALMTIVGVSEMASGTLGRAPTAGYEIVPESAYATGLTGLAGAFLLMRAFSSGCAALTGVEAISNGVPVFRRPKSRNAALTLAMLGGIAAAMMLSILLLARSTGVVMVDDPAAQLTLNGAPVSGDVVIDPVIGQLASAVFGPGTPLFLLVTITTGLILVLAANTAFNGFPSLASVLSRSSYLPRQLYKRGDRLSYSNGILMLASAAAVLVVVSGASVTRLIQLYIVGVFVSFTLSQFGMIRHWNREMRRTVAVDARRAIARSRAINIAGFLLTGLVLAVVLATKFTRGAWIAILMMAVVFAVQRGIRHHYDTVADQLRVEDHSMRRALPARMRALVLVSNMARPTMRAISTARATAPSSLELVSVVSDDAEEERILQQWEESGVPVPLTLLSSPFRDITDVVVSFVRNQRRRSPGEVVFVYLPQFLVSHWWENAMHNQTATRLRRALLRVPGVLIVMVPWELGKDVEIEGTRGGACEEEEAGTNVLRAAAGG